MCERDRTKGYVRERGICDRERDILDFWFFGLVLLRWSFVGNIYFIPISLLFPLILQTFIFVDNCNILSWIGQPSYLVLCTSWRFPYSCDERNKHLRCSPLHSPLFCLLTIFWLLLDYMHSTFVRMLEYPSNCRSLMQRHSKMLLVL